MPDKEIDELLWLSGNNAGRPGNRKSSLEPTDADYAPPPAWRDFVIGFALLVGGSSVFVWFLDLFADLDSEFIAYGMPYVFVFLALMGCALVAAIGGGILIARGIRNYSNQPL